VITVERTDFVSVPVADPDGNALMLHRRYAP
jgi:hypothetical protein